MCIVSLLGVLLIGFTAWVGARGLMAKSDLEAAQAMIGQFKSQIADFDVVAAQSTFEEISQKTGNARQLTDDLAWRATESVPWLGKNHTAVREIAAVADDVMSGVGSPLVDVAEGINPASFAPKDGAIEDLAPFEEAVPVLIDANSRVKSALATAKGIDTGGTKVK